MAFKSNSNIFGDKRKHVVCGETMKVCREDVLTAAGKHSLRLPNELREQGNKTGTRMKKLGN